LFGFESSQGTSVNESTSFGFGTSTTNVNKFWFSGASGFTTDGLHSHIYTADFTGTGYVVVKNATIIINEYMFFDNISVKEVTDWTVGDGWSVDDGVASSDGTQSGNSNLWQDISAGLTNATTYRVEYTISNYSAGTINSNLGGTVPAPSHSGNDTFVDIILTNNLNDQVYITASSDFIGSISNISVKEVTDWILGDGWSLDGDNKMTCDGTQTGNSNLNQHVVRGLENGTTYSVEYTVSDYSAGTINSNLGGTVSAPTHSENGTFNELIIPDSSTNNNVYITANSNFIGSVSNLSIKEIVNSVHDYSKNENGGVLYTGKALEFDGVGDYVDVNGLEFAGDTATFAFWLNSNDTLGRVIDANPDRLIIGFAYNELSIYSSGFHLFGTITTGEFHRVAIVINGTSAKCYVDGVQLGTEKTIVAIDLSDTDDVILGANYNATDSWLKGKLSDFQIYDKAWTPSDVKYDWEHPEKDVFDDVDRPEILGEEEVVNGGFDTDVSDWTAASGATLSIDNQRLKVVVSGTSSQVEQTFNTEVGKTYRFTLDYDLGTSTKIAITLNDGVGGLVNEDITSGDGSRVYEFVATASTTRIDLYAYTDGTHVFFDNISVKEVIQHASTILPTDCKALYRLNEGAGDKVFNSAVVLGVELVENGDFTTDEGIWSPYDDANINDTVPEALYLPNGGGHVTQSILESGKLYRYVVVAKSGTSTLSDMNLQTDSTPQAIIEDVPTNYTTYTGIIASNGTSFLLGEGSGGSLIVDSISLKQITPASASQSYTNATTEGATWAPAQRDIPQLGMVSYSKKMIFGGDSSDDYIEVANDSAINMGDGDFTLSCVALVNSDTGESQRLIDKRGSYGYNLSYFYSSGDSNGKIKLEMRDGTSPVLNVNISDDPLPLGELASVIASFDRSGYVTCYINGVAQTPVDISNYQLSLDTTLPLLFGGDTSLGTSNNLNGFIDEISIFNKALTYTEVTELYNAGTALDARDHSESANLLGYWRNNGTDDWDDLSTNSNDGTVNGSPETIILQEGVLFGKDSLGLPMNKVRQKGLNLDGTGYVKVADDNSLDITTTITLEAWIKLDPFVVGNLDHIIGKRVSGPNWCRLYRPEANVIRMEIQAGHQIDIDVVDGEWCHIIGTIDGTTGKLYYNNGDPEEMTYGVTFTWDTDIPIGIGAWFTGDSTISTTSKTIGTIDEPRVYNRVLSAKEIKKNYKTSKAQHKNDNTVSNWSDDFTNDFI
jgi:hypothetical protein